MWGDAVTDSNSAYPLQGLRVLDFSRVLAGPFAGRMLCDLGADVVKVEPPDGDVTRLWGKRIANLPGYYHQQNAGKRNICLDLRQPGASALVLELATKADILIENYRPHVMQKMGIDYPVLSAANPRLIMLSITGFGQSGPEADRPAYAPVIHAEAGLMHRAAERFGVIAHDLPLSVADTNASLHGLVAVLSALHLRQSTGRGQHIDMAMIDATLATDDHMHYDLEVATGTGPLPNEVWETPAGPVLLTADVRFLWQLLSEHCGLTVDLPAGADLAQKIAARHDAITRYLRELPDAKAFEDLMRRLNIAWGLVRDASTLRTQSTVAARRAIVDIDDRAGGTRPITQSPYRFSDARSGVRGPAPHRGEHNETVITEWLGAAPNTVQELTEQGVLHAEPVPEPASSRQDARNSEEPS
jgi:crotonobetainyl-CoA:carnitine CoA-transferase CaiB-like acyl-CoA transferase